MTRFEMVRAQYPNASDETVQRYCDLRDEGHSQYAAALMAGLSDPPEPDDSLMSATPAVRTE